MDKGNTHDGGKGNGGMMPHSGKMPRGKKGASMIKGGGHKMAPGTASASY